MIALAMQLVQVTFLSVSDVRQMKKIKHQGNQQFLLCCTETFGWTQANKIKLKIKPVMCNHSILLFKINNQKVGFLSFMINSTCLSLYKHNFG